MIPSDIEERIEKIQSDSRNARQIRIHISHERWQKIVGDWYNQSSSRRYGSPLDIHGDEIRLGHATLVAGPHMFFNHKARNGILAVSWVG